MKTLKDFTPEKQKALQVYLKNALDVGYDTTPLDKEKTKASVIEISNFLDVKNPIVIFLESPAQCQIIGSYLNTKKVSFKDEADLQAQVNELLTSKKDLIKKTKVTYDSGWITPAWWWASYYNFYLYIRNEFFPELKNEFPLLDTYINWSKTTHYIQAVNNIYLCSDRPKTLFVNQRGLNHESAMALEYNDGFGLYSLNGVSMSGAEWFFDKTMSDQEKAPKIISHQNVEQRAEMARVFGYSKLYGQLNKKVLDKGSDGYELWGLDLGTGRHEEFLKMVNPSTGEIHVECVVKGVKTADEALKSRWPQRMLDKYPYTKAKARA